MVVSMLSLSEGLKKSIMQELQTMGPNMILVFPGDSFDFTTLISGAELEDKEVNAVKRARGVDVVLEMPWTAMVVRYYQESKTNIIFGVSLDEGSSVLKGDMGWSVTDGDFARPSRREIMVGSLVPKDIFPGLEPGETLNIGGRNFVVSGVLRSLGNRQDDMSIAMDLPSFREVTGRREGTPMAMVRIQDGFGVEEVMENIEAELQRVAVRTQGSSEKSFSVTSSEAVMDMVDNILGVLQLAVVAFASIAILVGGIGIMNTMFTSVKERTKEIGVLKAVGAKRIHITTIFLFESGIIGFIGGVGGVFLGTIVALTAEIFLKEAHPVLYIEAHIPLWLIVFGLTFSFLIGCLSGFLPARQASKLEPVEALRYE